MRALLIFCALAACTNARLLTPTPVSYRLTSDDISAFNIKADQHCLQYGQRAAIDGIKKIGNDRVISYSCASY